MDYADWFVGTVACVLGASMIYGALRKEDRLFEVPKVRFFASVWGREPVRWIIIILGVLLIIAGVAIAMGFSLSWIWELAKK